MDRDQQVRKKLGILEQVEGDGETGISTKDTTEKSISRRVSILKRTNGPLFQPKVVKMNTLPSNFWTSREGH